VVHVLDASRAVGVAGSLLSDGLAESFAADVKAEYAEIRLRRADRKVGEPRLTIAEARARKVPVNWSGMTPPVPTFTGVRVLEDYDLDDLAERIDWTPFFQTWEMAGHYPAILDDAVVGEQARVLFADAQQLLRRAIDGRWLQAKAVFGFWPANAVHDDDIALYADEARTTPLAVLHTIRQQMAKTDGRPNFALADFVAPRDQGLADYVGLFAVTTGLGLDAQVAKFEAEQDVYNAILLKALADRLAEAFAERLHERVRREFWGYAPNEALSNEAIIKEAYQGIRPAPGYPACPDHTEKKTIFSLLDVERRIGVQLTESFAMYPTAAVSGYYFWHPEARYFGTGKIDRDQVTEYAERKGVTLKEAERWLSPVLNYDR
jgi:5-methyltetrahydrofolate--homocysteine methyltransferase